MIEVAPIPLMVEDNINTPEKLASILEVGLRRPSVASSITHPQLITKTFVKIIK